jgi:lipopolysaccharide/colanic/teichoic acid biosynthesis glycosyltransferase
MPDAASLLKLGIDDCFQLPVNSDELETRINFLRTFKKQKQTHQAKPDDVLAPKLPWQKRLFDITFASAALLAVSPLLLISALAIKLTDGGDITYTSKRVGTGYNIFDFLKLRSMYADADQRLEEMKKLNQYEEGSVFQKFANDPRVTPIGKIIRKFSIDELPQLINVIKGDMSIVGNRPLPLYEAQELTRDDWARRFLAPAGITGLWQVSKRGKNDMSMQERIDLDISYANNWSFWYDIKLILRTPFSIVQSSDV